MASDFTSRIIFHVDLDAFFVAVERVLDPSLQGKPVVVGGSPSGRGVVAAASYEARAYGVRSAMPMARAVRLCPSLVRVRGSRDAYRRASKAVFARFHELTPQVQGMSIDEAYLDLSEQLESAQVAEDCARALQRRVREELRLDLSVGIASNRVVAKVASGQAKPCGVLRVLPGEEAAFLAPLPVRKLPGIGPATAARLADARIRTLGELVAAEPRRLQARLGHEVERLQRRAAGVDLSPVRVPDAQRLPKSISQETTFAQDRRDRPFLLGKLQSLLSQTAQRLRSHSAVARTVSVKLRHADFTTLTRDCTLPHSGRLDADFLPSAQALLEGLLEDQPAVRLLGVKLAGIHRGCWQPTLFEPRPELSEAVARSESE